MRFFIDVQGTLIDDKNRLPINGAIDFINSLNKKNFEYLVITNNTKKSSKDFLAYLNGVGLNIDEKNYIDPFYVLKEILKYKKIAAYGVDGFIKNLENLGYEMEFNNPKALLISVRDDYDFEDFAKMIHFLLKGAELFGMHKSAIYVKNSKKYPGVGALLEMLSFATNKEYKVVGKPSKIFFDKALEKLKKVYNQNFDFNDIYIISDDVIGDLVGAKKLGMKTIFVLSGKFNDPKIIENLSENLKPDFIVKDIKEAGKLLGVI